MKDISIYQLISSYLFVIILLFIVRKRGIEREKEILIASIRMSLQLMIMGYILVYIIENPSPLLTLLILIFMEGFSIYNIYKRAKVNIKFKLKIAIAISMIIGTVLSIAYFLFVIINIYPWFNPRYFIPIAGMFIGNSMTGVSLGVNRLVDDIRKRKDEIEAALMLGATPKMAVKNIIDSAFDSSILPTVNSMVGMGIVFLPGTMTGQILSGTWPLVAIKYQISIMLGVLGSVAITVMIFLYFGYKTYFNDEAQLVVDE
ncbi:putative ABC transport system permease protein [Caloramator fervidus]|uniref:Putative ABC transport system permease protein n=1 Tax=Caloramator fervidus TaxID=29344 RepID=A0A1H5VH78_9CLOT|nr:iron export ABC transporter permease subunit FetB [Caloramator fervidus]SEF86574.1 putative ABC transport system permease protein [Caloramator fervidus]